MTVQWAAVSLFLSAELGVLLVLCLPCVSAQRWQTIFRWGIWSKIAPFWNKGFLTMIIVLIVLFFDAVREVRKYAGAQQSKDSKMSHNMFDHMHTKLFRAQRNLYISGFSLFFWLVMWRIITLITQLAVAKRMVERSQNEAENSNLVAQKYMEDNEHLKKVLEEGKTERKTAEVMRKEVQKLTEELRISKDGLKRSQVQLEVLREQKDNLILRNNQLLQEMQNYIKKTDGLILSYIQGVNL